MITQTNWQIKLLYQVLGMGWIYAPTRIPLIGALADKVYGIWVRLRLRITGRADLATLVAQRCGKSCELRDN